MNQRIVIRGFSELPPNSLPTLPDFLDRLAATLRATPDTTVTARAEIGEPFRTIFEPRSRTNGGTGLTMMQVAGFRTDANSGRVEVF